jgi:hypothetical protein
MTTEKAFTDEIIDEVEEFQQKVKEVLHSLPDEWDVEKVVKLFMICTSMAYVGMKLIRADKADATPPTLTEMLDTLLVDGRESWRTSFKIAIGTTRA